MMEKKCPPWHEWQSRKMRNRLNSLKFVLIFLVLGCSSSSEQLLRKAQQDALDQKPQLAKYVLIQLVKDHKVKDSVRFRALKSLSEVALTQLHDYPTAVQALEMIFDEFSQVRAYKQEIDDLRVLASRVYRVNLQNPRRALDMMTPMMTDNQFHSRWGQELGRVYTALRNFEEAEHWYQQSWSMARQQEDCQILRELQLELIQLFSVQDRCDQSLSWANQSLPETCERDDFAIAIEKAHCYEIQGEVSKAMRIYEKMIEGNPDNLRAHFFLESLKRRQREKQVQ